MTTENLDQQPIGAIIPPWRARLGYDRSRLLEMDLADIQKLIQKLRYIPAYKLKPDDIDFIIRMFRESLERNASDDETS